MPKGNNYNIQIDEFIKVQMKDWPFLANNYSDLDKTLTKRLQFEGFDIVVQFNPARIISSSAKIDKASIEKRPCFLCSENRPPEQKSLDFKEDFLILINPYPIFPQHLTIINKNHTPQLIEPYFSEMLELAKCLPTFSVFYNGPKCGASAPDHFHFQAGTKVSMPLINQITDIKKKFGKLQKKGICNVWKINDGVRTFFHLESDDKLAVMDVFTEIHELLGSFSNSDNEPEMNVLCSFTDNLWQVQVFPRGKHRPWQYSAQGEENILFSPASVDLGGLLIIPRKNDFEKININLVVDMMQQICLADELFNNIDLNH